MIVGNKIRIVMSCVVLLLTALLLLGISYTQAKGERAGDFRQNTVLLSPTQDDVLKNGYPTNNNGQTYGPDMGDLIPKSPDLMLAEGKGGVIGYIYSSQQEGAASPDKIDEYYDSIKNGLSIPLYLHDGETVIGEFEVCTKDWRQ